MIDIDKKYRTRDGREVRIYATDGVGLKSVHGAYFDVHTQGWASLAWTDYGSVDAYKTIQPLDLIEVRPRHKRTVWLNVYGIPSDVTAYNNKWKADQSVSPRIACIKVELDFEEGEGL